MPDTKKLEELNKEAVNYYNGNSKKNQGATEERKAKGKIETLFVNLFSKPGANQIDEVHEVKISDTVSLNISFKEEISEEIDPKKFMEAHPDKFWALVSIPKTEAIKLIGEHDAAKVTRPVSKTQLRIEKKKSGV